MSTSTSSSLGPPAGVQDGRAGDHPGDRPRHRRRRPARDALMENLHRQQLNPLEEAARTSSSSGLRPPTSSCRARRSRPHITHAPAEPPPSSRVAAECCRRGTPPSSLDSAGAREHLAQRIVQEAVRPRRGGAHRAPAVDERGAAEGRRKPVSPHASRNWPTSSDRYETRSTWTWPQQGQVIVEFATLEDSAHHQVHGLTRRPHSLNHLSTAGAAHPGRYRPPPLPRRTHNKRRRPKPPVGRPPSTRRRHHHPGRSRRVGSPPVRRRAGQASRSTLMPPASNSRGQAPEAGSAGAVRLAVATRALTRRPGRTAAPRQAQGSSAGV